MNNTIMDLRKLSSINGVCGALSFLVALLFVGVSIAAPSDDFNEATRLYQQGKLDVALSKVNGFLGVQPKDAQGRFLKGLILTEQKKSDEAVRVFTGLTEDFPELPEPYNNLAVLYASQGNYDKAKSALELAIHTHPSYATAHENLGDIYAQLARRAYDKALQLDKNNTAAQSKLSMVKNLFAAPKSLAPTTPTALASKPITKTEPIKTAAVNPPPAPEVKAPIKAAPVAPPAPAQPVAQAPSVDAAAQITAAVNAWAKAWSEKNVAGYLASYAGNFETPNGEARKLWEEQRRERITKPKSISVTVKIVSLDVNGDTARVTLRQTYRSDALKANSTKTLSLVKSGDRWLIRQERVGG